MNIDVNSSNRSSSNLKSSLESSMVYMGLFKKLSQSTHYAGEIKKRADLGKLLLSKHQNIKKMKFHFYNHTRPFSAFHNKTMDKIVKWGGEIVTSHTKPINFLVVPDSIFRLTNSQMLKEDSEFFKSLDNSSNYWSAKSSAEKSLTNIKNTWNERALRLMSSSPSFAHNPAQFEKELWKTPQKKKKREEIKNNDSEYKLSSSGLQTPENNERSIERYSDPKQSKHRDDFKNLFEFLNWKRWNLVTYESLSRKLDIILSNSINWHIEKGFQEIYSGARHMILTAFNNKSKKGMKQNFHTFPYNSAMKAYDVNKLNLDAPEGTSIFQNENERTIAEENYAKLMNKYQSSLFEMRQLKSCKSEFFEQEPLTTNYTCTIWNIKYYTIFEHWASAHHKKWIEDHKSDYDEIDKLLTQLNSELAVSKPKEWITKKIQIDEHSMKFSDWHSSFKNNIKSKRSQPIEKYIHDRVVIMQIETKSQPSDSKASSKMSCMIESSDSRVIEEEKIQLAKNKRFKPLNGLELSGKLWNFRFSYFTCLDSIRPYPQIKTKVRRHVLKYNHEPVRRSKRIKNKELKRSTHNKRLRQTYFMTSFHSKNKSLDNKDETNRKIKRKKYRDTTLDEFFPIVERPEDEEMLIEDCNNDQPTHKNKLHITEEAKAIIKKIYNLP